MISKVRSTLLKRFVALIENAGSGKEFFGHNAAGADHGNSSNQNFQLIQRGRFLYS
jgi:hypothetical protein